MDKNLERYPATAPPPAADKKQADPKPISPRTENGRKLFTCPYKECGKQFTESGNLKTHIRIHTGERPFACEYTGCGKSFITKGHLKSHILTHTGEKPHTCTFCGKKYSRIGRLTIHTRTHTGEKPFQCPYDGCHRSFTEKGNLKTHLRIHTGEKPYACTIPGCDKRFTTQGHLKDHIRRHNNERSFVCSICGASFLRASTLKIHNRRHTGERPYKCPHPDCGKCFSESGNLKTHMRTHDGSKEGRRHGKRRRLEGEFAAVSTKAEAFKVPEDNLAGGRKSFPEENKDCVGQRPGLDSINIDELPACDPDFVRSPRSSFYQSQIMSPPCFPTVKGGYESPMQPAPAGLKPFYPYGIVVAPTPSTYNQNVHDFQRMPTPSPPLTFGGGLDFTTFAGMTPHNPVANPQHQFCSGSTSPCFTGLPYPAMYGQGLMGEGNNAMCKGEESDG